MSRTAVFLGILFLLGGATADAQQRQGATGGFGGATASSGSSGMFGARSLGGSLSAGNRGFASGGSAAGAAGVQSAVPGATTRAGADQQVGQLQNNERFTRRGRQAGQFVGSDTSDLPGFLTELANGGLNAGQANRGQQRGQRQGQNANQQGGRSGGGARAGQQKVKYRISRNIGFDYNIPAPAEVQSQLGTRLQSLPGVRATGPIAVSMEQRTVVLRGSVATAHDRDLAERLALLEAGVDQVRNELTIGPPAEMAAPTPPTPAN